MGYQEDFYPESRFGGFTDIDGTIAFYARVNELAGSAETMVNFGCGRGAFQEDEVEFRRELRRFDEKVERVIGLDIDPAAESNPYIDEFHLLEGTAWPVESGSVDLVLSDYVLEHIADPDTFFEEASRVLRSGGYLCARTANALSYPIAVARLIPDDLHASILGFVQDGRREEDVFPKYYRCNTPGEIDPLLERHGFEGTSYCYEAEPAYLDFSKWAYRLGVLHQKWMPNWFAPALFIFGQAK